MSQETGPFGVEPDSITRTAYVESMSLRQRCGEGPYPCPPQTESPSAQESAHPDHHLWRNGRLFWVAFTIHVDGWRVERIRRSLGTADIVEARHRRDALFAEFEGQAGVALSLRPQATARLARAPSIAPSQAFGGRLELAI